MTPQEWSRLMRQARAHALLHSHRVKVSAVRLPERFYPKLKLRWAYVIDCPARARDFMRGH